MTRPGQVWRQYSDIELVEELRRVAALVPAGPLTTARFRSRSRLSVSTLLRRFGSWRRALDAAGLVDRYSGRPVSEKMRKQSARWLTDVQLLAELRQVRSRTRREHVTVADLRTYSAVSERVFVTRFGSWPAAVAAAGLTVSPRGRYWTEGDLAANLRKVILWYRKTPTSSQMDRPPSTVTSDTYRRRYGTMAQAREALGLADADRPTTATSAPAYDH